MSERDHRLRLMCETTARMLDQESEAAQPSPELTEQVLSLLRGAREWMNAEADRQWDAALARSDEAERRLERATTSACP